MVEDKDMDRLREVFVTRRECENITDGIEKNLGKDNVRLSVIETELKQIKWLAGLALAGIVANLINSFFAMIGG